MNQTDVSNASNIFTPPSTPVNLEEDQTEENFNEAIENEIIQENFRALKQQQKQGTTNTTTTTSI